MPVRIRPAPVQTLEIVFPSRNMDVVELYERVPPLSRSRCPVPRRL
jgi:hypothetical protein